MEIVEEFESIKNIVKELLETDKRCRNSDKFLIFRILKQSTNFNMTFEEFDKCPCFESVRRMRQKLQEEDPNLRADSEVVELREKKRESISRIIRPSREIIVLDLQPKERTHGIEVKQFVPERVRGVEVFE